MHRILLAGLAALMLAACATQPGGSGGSVDHAVRDRARTHLELAGGYYEHGQHQIALGEQRRAVQIDPSFAEAWDMGGIIHLALGDRQTARTQFQQSIKLKPDNASAISNLGWLECEAGNFAEAEQHFQRALAVPNPNRPGTLLVRGICQARAGDSAQAEQTLIHAYELDASNPLTGYNLSLLLHQRGEYERARFYMRRINNSELANAESLWLGIRIERRMGDMRAAEQLALQLHRRFPDSSEWMAYQQGRFND